MIFRKKKPYKIKPEPENPNWHEHLCLIYRLGPRMFETFCPWKGEVVWGPECGDDCCDHCPYDIRVDFDKETGIVQLWGDVNVLHPDYDFTKIIFKEVTQHGSHS